jgi:hypothetical protein
MEVCGTRVPAATSHNWPEGSEFEPLRPTRMVTVGHNRPAARRAAAVTGLSADALEAHPPRL